MTALAAARDTKAYGGHTFPEEHEVPIADSVVIYQGGMVGLDSAGRARPMTVSATTANCAGVALKTHDNTVTGHAADAYKIRVATGVFLMINDTSTPCTNANRGAVCYALDDATVTGSATSNAIAGTIIDVPGSTEPGYGGVWVLIAPVAYSGSDATAFAASLVSGGVVLGDLQKVTVTPGSSSGNAIDIVCAIKDLGGSAISGARQVMIRALSVTGGTGKNVLAAATSAVGTIVSSAGANAAAGASVLLMTTGATGLFSFKISDSTAEAVFYEIIADGCRPVVKTATISA